MQFIYFEKQEITENYFLNPSRQELNSSRHLGRPDYERGYQCPIKCEGSKTFDQPANCPVCLTNQVLVELLIRKICYGKLNYHYVLGYRNGLGYRAHSRNPRYYCRGLLKYQKTLI